MKAATTMQRAYSTFTIKSVDEATGIIEGIASTPSTDRMGDVVDPEGAHFTLPIPLLWQHRSGEPIGVYTTVKEDTIGLHVEGKLALKTARGAEAYELLKMGAISGLSIGFVTREDSYDRVTGVRTLKKVDLWEVSLVTFPANDSARVANIKSIESIKSLADAETYLREAGGLSKREAVTMLARIKSLQGRSESDGLGELEALIKRNTSLLKH